MRIFKELGICILINVIFKMDNVNTKEVTVPYDEYIHLLKLRRYVNDWYPNYAQCEICGNYHPVGYVCIICE